ncbi:DUF4097 family beta strand repeat-containing protein [Streptomyces viridiviolaceus]|uniref:DUF4097 family beta strand repeat-containing protein n=1 Tax=Streptomyces viridiviolaceus TaxID=68282 RepID=A0ABW2E6T4_9ACTN|nr:DUF4097 family beta strand repeat-containing protein [Streptomyces viridiviolaceus]
MSVALTGAALTACNGKTTVEESQYEVDEKVTSLRIRTNGGNVEVVAASSSGVSVTERVEYADEKPRTEHSVRKGELSLSATGCARSDASEYSVDYTVAVPRGAIVSVETGGGDISVRGLSGVMEADTGGGNVRIRQSAMKKLSAHTGGGNLDTSFTAAPGQVEAESEGGNITVRLPEGTYAVDARTDGGDREVGIASDPSSAHKVKAYSGGGNITVGTAD